MDSSFNEVSHAEVICILQAFSRHQSKQPLNDSISLCFHEVDDYSMKQESMIRKQKMTTKDKGFGPVNSIFVQIRQLSRSVPSVNLLRRDFFATADDMSYGQTLMWCASLLIDFHEEKDCSEHMNMALKFILLAYFYGAYIRFDDTDNVLENLMDLLEYISRNKCEHSLFIQCINIFLTYFCGDCRDFLSPRFLSGILDTAYDINLNFFRFSDKSFNLMKDKFVQRSLFQNGGRYLILSKFGHVDVYYENAISECLSCVQETDMYDLFGFQDYQVQNISNVKYRAFQVVFLFIESIYYGAESREIREMYDKILRVLWKTIADPFLTAKQFMSSFEQSKDYPGFVEAFEWYVKVVRKHKDPNNSPRSLKHLARCVVRQTLTDSVQMPYAIDWLHIPDTLKRYLSLENLFCGI